MCFDTIERPPEQSRSLMEQNDANQKLHCYLVNVRQVPRYKRNSSKGKILFSIKKSLCQKAEYKD